MAGTDSISIMERHDSYHQGRPQEQDSDSTSSPHPQPQGFLKRTKKATRSIWQKTNPTDSQSFRLKFEEKKAAQCLDKTRCYIGYARYDTLCHKANNG